MTPSTHAAEKECAARSAGTPHSQGKTPEPQLHGAEGKEEPRTRPKGKFPCCAPENWLG